ncbi:hypothetical protein [Ruegeria aquimaris]|uniref:Uncharacterized protein n=1 Tax=Ruegeria aquimaris TaxID=2984333 RepID=A0ABT3AMD6_9RHOB|nr:hypothetical protein [Ruegeria sp. XHP0148]MCV2889851.1 hypothetical protein [Ruegeria sp. XHP0148]
MIKTFSGIGAALFCATLLAAGAEAQNSKFALTGVSIAPLKTANLCSKIGGKGAQPELVLKHNAVAGAKIKVRMYDVHSKRDVTEHNTVRVKSSGSGQTVVNGGFRPPCNTTGGRKNSSYRFDISVDGKKTTVIWGNYDSKMKKIVP